MALEEHQGLQFMESFDDLCSRSHVKQKQPKIFVREHSWRWPSPLAMEELVQNGDTEKIESIEETEGVVQGAVKNDSVSRFVDEELELAVLTDCVDSIEECGRPDVGGAECSTSAAEDESPSSCEEFEVKVEVLAFEDEIAGASFMERKFKRGKQWDFGQPA
ncbi:hypothetical protein C8R42DRAFT_706571 [Lentinula raphanica]|nr:hypothetical protein C8R42DRAFT_706571 [Lentinula raphanica]